MSTMKHCILACLLVAAAVLAGCDTSVTMTFTYSNHGVDTVTFSSWVGTTGDWVDSSTAVPAGTFVCTDLHTVKKDNWFSCVAKDRANVTLDSIDMTGYEWKNGSAVTWNWNGAVLAPIVFIPGMTGDTYAISIRRTVDADVVRRPQTTSFKL
jgi:hypothetical protein